MSSYGYTKSNAIGNQSNNKPTSTLEWILLGLVTLILIWAPFQMSLFNGQIAGHEQKIYYSVMLTTLVAAVSAVAIYKSKSEITNRDILQLAVFVLPLVYLISLIPAVSNYLATNMVLIQFVCAFFFIASIQVTKNENLNSLIAKIIVGSAYSIVIFGLMHWFKTTTVISTLFGWFIPFKENGLYHDAVLATRDGFRLTSVFQYANTYAAYLMAFLFVALFYLTSARKMVAQAAHSFILVPILLSILLTLSRAGLVLLPVIFILVLLFIKPARQLLWFVHLGIGVIATVLIVNPVTEIGLALHNNTDNPQAMKGWFYVIAASLVVMALSLVIQRYIAPWLEQKLEQFSAKKFATAIIPVGGALVGIVLIVILIGTNAKSLLPENIATRLDNINLQQHSLLERIAFHKDALKMATDHPLFGAGGGAWRDLHEKYEGNPYRIENPHSFALQYLTDVGFVGFLVIFAFLIYIYYQYIRTYFKADDATRDKHFIYFIIATSILIHSLLDLNMHYVYIGMLVFFSLGGMVAAIDSKPLAKFKPTVFRATMTSVLALSSILLFITSIVFAQASSSYKDSLVTLEQTKNLGETMKHLDKAMQARPAHPEYAEQKGKLYTSVYKQENNEEFFKIAEDSFKTALEEEPYNKILLLRLMQLYEAKGLDDEVYNIMSKYASHFPWDMEWYTRYMDITFRKGYSAVTAQPEQKSKYLNEVIAAFKHVEAGVERIKSLPKGQEQGRPFHVSTPMALNAVRAYYVMGDANQAAQAVKPYLSEDLTQESNRELVRWYVAATIQAGNVDQQWYDKLLAAAPSEKEQVEQIAAMNFKAN
ncbi:O-antigen ligase family protein [Paenibacillus sp. 481]|uniref:O-antigen ligase family protein n=1 Tax=Paenibacillus sp. 481 TaxID=2835869 RepID=UPI001E58AC2F|nr:O-antigen ligase family protein [Paenibacillus sp. 481]UHA71646.1 O-antigen ligase family protein [Paenibacillus sp. 481]